MTSSWSTRVVYIAVLMGSIECVRCETSSSADRKQSDDPGAIVESGPAEDETRFLPDDVAAAAAKRKWGENTMSTWGKRSSESSDEMSSLPSKKARCPEPMPFPSRNRRKWGETSMSAWGKRSVSGCQDDDVESSGTINVEQNEKRKWGDNTMKVWGKRAASLIDDEAVEEADEDNVADVSASAVKRKWGDKSMSAWGKRRRETADEASSNRKWGSNSMTAWGKRGQLVPNSTPSRRMLNDVLLDTEDDSTEMTKGTSREVEDDRLDSLARSSTTHGGSVRNLSALLKGWNRRHHGVAWSPKRRWEMNTMKVWGKRMAQDDEPSGEVDA